MKKAKFAYSLIEMSIVLVVISTLVAGALVVSAENLKDEKIKVTKQRMDHIYKMMIHYLKTNKHLPCPAPLTKVKSVDSDYGTSSSCNASSGLLVGAVPIVRFGGGSADLAEDGFGTKFIYFVDSRFSVAPNLSSPPDFSVTNLSTMLENQFSASPSTLFTIKENMTGTLQTITTGAVFGIISVGANKLGGYNANSSSQNSTSGADADEITNVGAGSTLVSSSSTGSSFDDIVFYKTAKDLVSDNPDLLNLVPCRNSDNNYVSGSITGHAWYNGTVYSKTGVCAWPNQLMRFSKKCGNNGLFTALNESCAVTGSSSCSLSNGQSLGNGNQYYNGVTQAFPTGSLITDVKCSNNFGRIIIGGSRTSDDSTQTCSLSLTDRTTDSGSKPQAICSNGQIYVINGCTACRGCSNGDATSGTVVNDTTISYSMSCNSDSRTIQSIILDCRSLGVAYSLSHNATAIFGHARIRRCNCPCEQRNICNAGNVRCLDGYFSFLNSAGYYLGSASGCYATTIQCSSSSQSCGNGC